jgi:acyl-coenzyme A synthetase/AMP-(fatty) acid ligase
VDPSEVERVLARLDGIEEAVVTSAAVSNREEHIVRAFVACPSGTLAYETISRWCQSQLADHKVPRSIVILDALPRTARGKIDRVALAALTPDVRAAERDDA